MTNNKEALAALDELVKYHDALGRYERGSSVDKNLKKIRTALNAMQDAPTVVTVEEEWARQMLDDKTVDFIQVRYPRGIKIVGGEK